jgi:hypothetical protein
LINANVAAISSFDVCEPGCPHYFRREARRLENSK